MEESSPRVSRSNRTHEVLRAVPGPTMKSINRNSTVDDGEDLIECSGQFCRSCTAGVIADCIAICCCPCAVVNCLAFAFVKVPWKMAVKCLGLGKNKLRKRKGRRESDRPGCVSEAERDRGGNLRSSRRVEVGMEEFVSVDEYEYVEGQGMSGGSARFEAEKVWVELYQIGHLGFGRVSFTGNS